MLRLASWRCPEDFEPEEPVLFAEPLFNAAVCEQLGLGFTDRGIQVEAMRQDFEKLSARQRQTGACRWTTLSVTRQRIAALAVSLADGFSVRINVESPEMMA